MSTQPSKPWRVYGARGISTDHRSQHTAYDAVKTITGGGIAAKVYQWDRQAETWALYEVIQPEPLPEPAPMADPPPDGGQWDSMCSPA